MVVEFLEFTPETKVIGDVKFPVLSVGSTARGCSYDSIRISGEWNNERCIAEVCTGKSGKKFLSVTNDEATHVAVTVQCKQGYSRSNGFFEILAGSPVSLIHGSSYDGAAGRLGGGPEVLFACLISELTVFKVVPNGRRTSPYYIFVENGVTHIVDKQDFEDYCDLRGIPIPRIGGENE